MVLNERSPGVIAIFRFVIIWLHASVEFNFNNAFLVIFYSAFMCKAFVRLRIAIASARA